jgi:stage II sporulation protein D
MFPRYLTASLLALALGGASALGPGASSAQAASTFYITGGGDGHGIGMSQYGAYGYAMHGSSYRQILSHYYQGTSIGSTNPSQTVRVLIAVGKPSFSGAGSAAGVNNHVTRLSSHQNYSVHNSSRGQLQIYNQSGSRVATFNPPLRVSGTGPVYSAWHGWYRGALEFRPAGGSVQTVNAIDLEDYLRGVISAEMPASWSSQALEAQAVAARTYAITTQVNGNGYTLYSDSRSQMYRGTAAETSSTNAAVAATRGQIVTYNGSPAVTYFFASSGGHTEDIQNVWLGSTPEPWLQGVPDPYDNSGGNPYYRWSKQLSMSSAAAQLGSLVKGSFEGVTVTQRGVSPRVVKANVVGTGGTASVTGSQLQSDFGLLSTDMSFSTISAAVRQRPRAHTGLAGTAVALESAGIAPRLHGRVLPAAPGASVSVQRRVNGHWREVLRHVRLRSGGSYSAALAGAGLYRVVYRGLDGPAVVVR